MKQIVVLNNAKKSEIQENKIFKTYLGEIIDFEKFPSKIGTMEIENFSDSDLYDYCRFTGVNARIWSRRFVAAIPEVSHRGLYKKYGFYTIYEFAAKVGGITNIVVNNVLWLNEALKDKPILKSLIGDIGINKIRVVVKVVTKETESFWAQKVKDMSKPALEVLVREIKSAKEGEIFGLNTLNTEEQKCLMNCGKTEKQSDGLINHLQAESDNELTIGQKYPGINLTEIKKDGLFPELDQELDGGNYEQEQHFTKPERINFSVPIDSDTEFQLRKFKLNLEKARKGPADWNSTLKELVGRSANG